MNKIRSILFLHSGNQCYNSIEYFTNKIAISCQFRGIKVQHCQIEGEDATVPLEKLIQDGAHFDAVFAINTPFFHCQNEKGFLVNQLGDTIIDYILDHPFYHHETLSCPIENLNIICLDETHADFVKKHYPHVKQVLVMPVPAELCGTQSKEIKAFQARALPLMFTGTYTEPAGIRKKAEESIKPFDDIFQTAVKILIEHSTYTLEDAVLQAAKEVTDADEEKITRKLPEILFSAHYIDLYMRATLRESMIFELIKRRIHVHVFGHGWDIFVDKLDIAYQDYIQYLHLKGEVPYEKLPGLYADAKIALNQLPWFKMGCHDRIPLAMRNGAVTLTDGNPYLMETLGLEDRKHVVYYDIEKMDELPALIREVYEDSELLEYISMEAVKYADKHMTFDDFVGRLFGREWS